MAKIRLASIQGQELTDGDDSGGGTGGGTGGGSGSTTATPAKNVKVVVKKTTPEEPDDADYISINDSRNLKSGKFKKEHITNIIKAAKAVGVSPSQLLALTWQESNLGGTKEQILQEQKRRAALLAQGKRPGRGAIQSNLGQITAIDNPEEVAALATKTGLDTQYLAPAIILRNKLKEAKRLGFNDPALQLQMYNGVGKLKMQPGDRYYGQSYPKGGILDLRQNPLYGKRLIELSSDIDKNKQIQDLIKSSQ